MELKEGGAEGCVWWTWPSFTLSLSPLVFVLKFTSSGLRFCVRLHSGAAVPYLCAQQQKVCLSEWMGSINLSQPRLVDWHYGHPSFLLASLWLQLKQCHHSLMEMQLKHTSVFVYFIYHPDVTLDLLVLLDKCWGGFICLFLTSFFLF